MVQTNNRRTQSTGSSNVRNVSGSESERPANPMMSVDDIASYAAQLVQKDRNADYDHPLDNFTRIARIWEVILDAPVTAEQVALCMVGVKIGREVHKTKLDNTVDGIGYFLTLAMVQQERAERERLNKQEQ